MPEQAVTDLKSCEAWLERTALAEPRHACAALTVLLESLHENPPRDGDYVDVLERLREPIVVALSERAKKFSARPLPLSGPEREAFDQSLDLWQSLAAPYRRLFAATVENRAQHPDLRGQEALLAQRALDCIVDIMLSHYRCRREIDPDLWRELHRVYALADKAGVALETVSVGRKSKSVSSPAEVYARALLLALANPYALSSRELVWTRRWSSKWAYKVKFAQGGADCYAVDPKSGQPPMWVTSASNQLTFDASDIRRSIRGRIKKLEAGEDPDSLGLGNDCVQPDCNRLLVQLARAWTEQPAPRQFNRRSTPGSAQLATGFESIHIALTGRAFKATEQKWSYARRDQNEQMYSYHGAAQAAQAAVPPTENWEMLDESATGFRMRRTGKGERLSQLQLVALRPEDGRTFILSEVRWLTAGIDESLTIGLAVLPGVAMGIAIRPLADPNKQAEPYTQAFMLPETATGQASLILPTGFYQNGRVLEAQIEDDVRRMRVQEHLQRGYDYDRAAFVFIET